MKDHIEQETQGKKAGRDLKESFLFAASAFGRKWQNWRRKHKSNKKHGGRDAISSTTMQVDKPYSEVADYGFGRRSCDTDPRFSLDAAAARMSFDDPRYSWDEPRASWDGYLIGRTFPKMAPMVSVVEDAPVLHVPRSDNQIPVEEPRISVSDTDILPGGSLQTRDYYSDSQRRRKSFERSNSMRKKSSGGIVAEVEDGKVVGNAPNKEVSPPTSTDQLVQGPKLLLTDKDNWRDSNSNSLREDYSGSLESAFKDSASVCGGIERKGSKKSRRWSKPWNIWALIYRRNGSKDEEEERYHRGNVVERSFSESWQELRREPNGDSKGAFNRVFRSNSSVSARHSFSSVKSCAEANGNGKKRRDEFVLERNRSARYSPTNIDNGLLRFYLAPTTRRNGSVKSKPKNSSHSITNSVLRLY
ncbi:hypothetical protein Sjap_014015 [Stephania japonica]|uniref:Uncharacterized protein n=1 Tax=Stephania japonica TaxID=461633 RepID=A0AAP0J0U3_9MAGN